MEADATVASGIVKAALAKYQDPAEADQLTKIQRDLDETRWIVLQALDGVLRRGEVMDELVAKSAELSIASKAFYGQARKTNSCCKLM